VERFHLVLTPPMEAMRQWPHVVIVGVGFAGLRIYHALVGEPVRVTLIDKRHFTLFQPLLDHVASGLVSEADVASPLRQMVGQAPPMKILEHADEIRRRLLMALEEAEQTPDPELRAVLQTVPIQRTALPCSASGCGTATC
jgi:NADH dehydrogenase